MSSAYAKKYVKDNIVQSKNGTGKGYTLPMPSIALYPQPGAKVPIKIGGKPLSPTCDVLYLAELMYELHCEVARLEKIRLESHA
jgi:hypothetical protein